MERLTLDQAPSETVLLRVLYVIRFLRALVLHVVDSSSPAAREHCTHVVEVLQEIGAEGDARFLGQQCGQVVNGDDVERSEPFAQPPGRRCPARGAVIDGQHVAG